MASKIDQAIARSAHLKDKSQTLESELAALTKEQAEMDSIRLEQYAYFETAKAGDSCWSSRVCCAHQVG